MSRPEQDLELIRAPLLADARAILAPGVLLRRGSRILAAGTPEGVGAVAGARVRTLPAHALLPALGNAHAHLDLTTAAAVPFTGDFVGWLGGVRAARGAMDAAAIHASVAAGVAASLAGGVALVGDVTGREALGPARMEIERQRMGAVLFREIFGLGARGAAGVAAVAEEQAAAAGGEGRPAAVRHGLEPHAPYSAGEAVHAAALRSGLPVTTHLAEFPEEVELIRGQGGRLLRMLEQLGVVDDSVRWPGLHPVEWFCRLASGHAGPALAVHLECLADGDAARLAAAKVVAVTCPRASAWFHRPGAPWRRLRDAGVLVALGTDGAACLDTPGRISTLDEMRTLAARDGATLEELLPLATTCVARALGFPEAPFTLAPGVTAGILAVPLADPAAAVRSLLGGSSAPLWIEGPDVPAALAASEGR